MSRSTYIFLDESGNLDFSANGTRYFVLTSVSMERPFSMYDALDGYRYDCIERGGNIEYFHCYNDRRAVRNAVFDMIVAHLDGIHVDCLVVEKPQTSAAMREDMRFYPMVLGHLLSMVVPAETDYGRDEEIIVIADTIPLNKRRRSVEKAVRTTLSKMLPRVKYCVLHHQSRSHYGLQVADYFCWAAFRKLERGDGAWYDRIKPAVRNEFRITDV